MQNVTISFKNVGTDKDIIAAAKAVADNFNSFKNGEVYNTSGGFGPNHIISVADDGVITVEPSY
ncbi:MAG: hypothetical protein U9Q66_01670 [Patescibacteria group bacterium]|nr:hypothetical protein [Patescibacteria group bacterium]